MSTPEYSVTAQAYTNGVRALFAPASLSAGERGGGGPVSSAELVQQASQLAPVSADLTQAAGGQLSDSDPAVRVEASTKLLAKALVDLEISAYLLSAAELEEEGMAWSSGTDTDRSAVDAEDLEKYLKILLDEVEARPAAPERGIIGLEDLPAARVMLSETVETVLDLILDRASRTGQSALQKLVSQEITEGVLAGLNLAGTEMVEVLDQTENVKQLYALFQSYAISAYNSLLALVGDLGGGMAVENVVDRMIEWMKKYREQEYFSDVLEAFYETQHANQLVSQLMANSKAELPLYEAAIERVSRLDGKYLQQIELCEKLLKKMNFLWGIPAALLASPLVAGIYVLLGGYVILAGADYVDAPQLTELMNRVQGVRQIVESIL